MKASLVAVTYRSLDVLPGCVATFRREADAAGVAAEVVVVEQSESREEADAARAAGADLVLERPNRGYAAGLNAGVAAATGEVLLLANPDVELEPGCLAALLAALDAGCDVVGPRLVWDAAGRLLLPPPDDPAATAEVWRLLRCASPLLWRLGASAAFERCARLWTATGAAPVTCLRGPLLALRRDTWEAIGPLDEGYFLYWEETEWLWRAHRAGRRLALVGPARAVHRFGHATRTRPDRGAVEARSRRRFVERNYPGPVAGLLGWLEGLPSRGGVEAVAVAGPHAVPHVAADLWLLSPYRHLQPAAGWVGGAPPDELAGLTASGRWVLAAAHRRGGRLRLVGCWSWGEP